MGLTSDKWLTVIGYCLNTFSNGLMFGIYTSNFTTFALYYNEAQTNMDQIFFIGLGIEMLLCIPALKSLEWRLDYSVFAGAFLTAAAFWVLYLSHHSFYFAIAANILAALGQCFFLPTSLFISERWFQLEQRSYVIGLSFYANFLGFYTSAFITALYVGDNPKRVSIEAVAFAIISTATFLVSLFTVRNKPKGKYISQQKVQFKHIKQLWKYKFNAYAVIVAGSFLGMSWTFLSSSILFIIILILASMLLRFFSAVQLGVLILILLISGIGTGVLMSFTSNYLIQKTGSYKYYDLVIHLIILSGILGYLSLGICQTFYYWNFPLTCFFMFLSGVGGISALGLMLSSFSETLYPAPPLLVSTIFIFSASLYSLIVNGIALYSNYNIFYLMVFAELLPWIYLVICYRTDFKRYKYYINQQQTKYELLKIQIGQHQIQSSQRSSQLTEDFNKFQQQNNKAQLKQIKTN